MIFCCKRGTKKTTSDCSTMLSSLLVVVLVLSHFDFSRSFQHRVVPRIQSFAATRAYSPIQETAISVPESRVEQLDLDVEQVRGNVASMPSISEVQIAALVMASVMILMPTEPANALEGGIFAKKFASMIHPVTNMAFFGTSLYSAYLVQSVFDID